MKFIFTITLTLIIIACINCNDLYIKKTDVINISEISVPDSSLLNEIIRIYVKAEANNGCWNNLYITLNKVDDFNYQLNGYGTFSYSHSHIDNVVKYIMNQEQHHKKRTFREEYIDLLKKFNIVYDERYILKDVE